MSSSATRAASRRCAASTSSVRGGRAVRDRRPVRLGQVDAAAHHGDARTSHERHRADRRHAMSPGPPTATLAALRARRIGFVFQQFHLIEADSALENVATGLLYTGTPARERRRAARAALDRVGLGASHRAHLGAALRRRAPARRDRARARQRAGDRARRRADRQPRHAHRRRSCWSCCGRSTTQGTTVVVITHDREIAATLPRRVELRDGRLVHDELVAHDDDRGVHASAPSLHAPATSGAEPSRRVACCDDVCGSRASGCARAACARRCRRSAWRSASPRWSPCWGSPTRARRGSWRSSTNSARTCSRSRPGRRSWARTQSCPKPPDRAVAHLASVRSAAAVTSVAGASVRRSPYIEAAETNGISVDAADPRAAAHAGWADAAGTLPGAGRRALSARRAGDRCRPAARRRAPGGRRAGPCRSTSATPGSPSPASSARCRSHPKSNAPR